MLIRSQDKERLMDFTRASVGIDHGESDENDIWITMMYSERDYGMLGRYSNEQKALKVMDMIQEAYADFESTKITSTGLATAAYTGSYDTPESVSHGIKVLKEYTELIKSAVIFQMPDDRNVKV